MQQQHLMGNLDEAALVSRFSDEPSVVLSSEVVQAADRQNEGTPQLKSEAEIPSQIELNLSDASNLIFPHAR